MQFTYNPEVALAERYVVETGVSIFLTGKAGTGKTTFLHNIVETCHKRSVVVAPTGVAAINAGGVTIHSFFQLPFCPYLPDVPELVTEYQLPESQKSLRKAKVDIIRTLDLLIIDEISMVRADLLDAIDAVLRRYRRSGRPFGGVQLLMIGDVQQLAPVVTDEERPYMERIYPSPFFFHSKALQKVPYVTIQLKTIYRQQDPRFVGLLNNIRDNHFDSQTLQALNARVQARPAPGNGQEPILLTTHNYQADAVNRSHLQALTTRSYLFDAEVEGNFPEQSAPTDRHLELKVGAQVMFVKNDSNGHRYYNGMLGMVEEVMDDGGEAAGQDRVIVVEAENGEHIFVTPERWENIRYEIDPSDNMIKQLVDGTFTQYPLRTAWAITVHKAQGLTFDRVQVDVSGAFTYGQVYVALSRCRSLEGLTLLAPITEKNSFGSGDIEQFNSSMTPPQQAEQMLDGYRSQYYYDMLFELFDFSGVQHAMEGLRRLFQEQLLRLYPEQAAELSELCSHEVNDMMSVAERFHRQLATIGAQPDSKALMAERVGKAAVYFGQVMRAIDERVKPMLALEIDNRETAKRAKDAAERYVATGRLKIRVLEEVAEKGFTIEGYQQTKVDFALQKPTKERSGRNRTKTETKAEDGPLETDLVERLSEWRKAVAEKKGVKPFIVLWQRTLMGIVKAMPQTEAELLAVQGMGPVSMAQYGDEILQIVQDYCKDHHIEPRQRRLDSKPEPKPSRKPKEKAEPTWERAVELLKQGKTVADVAETLGRAVSTVEGYVYKAVEAGALSPDFVVPERKRAEISVYMKEKGLDSPLKEVYEHFEGRFSYLQLRVARWAASRED